MPKFKNNQIKGLVNSFIVYVLEQLELKSLEQNDLDEITNNFN
jgi:hypothetical protein